MLQVSSGLGKQASCELNTYEKHYYNRYTNTAVSLMGWRIFNFISGTIKLIRVEVDMGRRDWEEGLGGYFQYCRHLVL